VTAPTLSFATSFSTTITALMLYSTSPHYHDALLDMIPGHITVLRCAISQISY
jgi:hypothetical protein